MQTIAGALVYIMLLEQINIQDGRYSGVVGASITSVARSGTKNNHCKKQNSKRFIKKIPFIHGYNFYNKSTKIRIFYIQ